MRRSTFTTRDRWVGVDMGEFPKSRFCGFCVDLRLTSIDRLFVAFEPEKSTPSLAD